jgi:hypothetical protein
MAGYSKDFLVECFAYRYEVLGLEAVETQYKLAYEFYDKVGREAFRKYASIDAQAISKYKNSLAQH